MYRTIELSEGFDGYLTRTEVFFFVLDFVPLLVALICYLPFWPGRFIPKELSIMDRSPSEETPRQPSTDGTLQDKTTSPEIGEKA